MNGAKHCSCYQLCSGVIKVLNAVEEEIDGYHTTLIVAYRQELLQLEVVKYLVETARVDANLPKNNDWKDTILT